MVSHLTRAAILICVLMLICVLFLCKMSVYIMFNHYMRHAYLTVWPALHCLMIQVQHDLLFSCNFFSMLTTHVHMYFLEVTFSKLCCAPVKTFRHLSKGANGRISHIRTDKEMKYVNCFNYHKHSLTFEEHKECFLNKLPCMAMDNSIENKRVLNLLILFGTLHNTSSTKFYCSR